MSNQSASACATERISTPPRQETPAVASVLHSIEAVEGITTLDKRTIQRLVIKGEFPKPVALPSSGTLSRRRAWRAEDIQAWIGGLPVAQTTGHGEAAHV